MNHCCYAQVSWPARQSGAALVVGLILLVVITLVGVSAMQNTTLQEKMAGNLRDTNLAFQASEAALRDCENIVAQNYRFQVAAAGLPPGNPLRRTFQPQAPLLDQVWQLINPTTSPATVVNPAVWIWSLDEGQAGFPVGNPVGNRLDPNTGNNQFWWTERNNAWWQSAASNSQLFANMLDGLFAPPRCILEEYTYAATDNSPAADALLRNRIVNEGVTITPGLTYRIERHYYRITSRGSGSSDNAVSMLQSSFYQNYYVPTGT